jgi:hypothetical protein
MDSQNFAEFMEKLGHNVIRTKSSWWFDVKKWAYMSFPFHISILPSADEIGSLLSKNGLMARYTCPNGSGNPSYYTVCSEKYYNFSHLSAKARNQTRRGLERCSIRRISFNELRSLGGIAINRDTILRQGRAVARTHDIYWEKYYAAAERTRNMEAWAALVADELAAFIICYSFNDCMTILYSASNGKLLSAYPNNALIYSFTKEALCRPQISQVSYGLASLQAGLKNLDHFKRGMGFVNISIGQRIQFHRLVSPFVSKPIVRILTRFVEAANYNGKIGQLTGVLHFYANQDVPNDCSPQIIENGTHIVH